MPKTIEQSIYLIITALLIFLMTCWYAYSVDIGILINPSALYLSDMVNLLIASVVHIVIAAALCVAIYQQRAWARAVFIMYTLFRLALLLISHPISTHNLIIVALIIIYELLQLAACVLLMRSSSDAWFKSAE